MNTAHRNGLKAPFLLYLVLLLGAFLLSPLNALSVIFSIPKEEDLVGDIIQVTVQEGDTLIKIGRHYNIGPREMIQANPGIKPHRLKIGQTVIIPQLFILPLHEYRKGIVINIAELRLYHFSEDGLSLSTFPVALGRQGWRTPTGTTSIRDKKEAPSWNVPTSIKNYTYNKTGRWLPDVVEPGPENPLGDYAIYLKRRGYLIHGTNNPNSIGTLASSGCIRMYNEDVEALFSEVNPGDSVTIINHAYKAGWRGNTLYLEALQLVSHNEASTSINTITPEDVIMKAAFYSHHYSIDWDAVEKVVREKTGVPEPVGLSHDQ